MRKSLKQLYILLCGRKKKGGIMKRAIIQNTIISIITILTFLSTLTEIFNPPLQSIICRMDAELSFLYFMILNKRRGVVIVKERERERVRRTYYKEARNQV